MGAVIAFRPHQPRALPTLREGAAASVTDIASRFPGPDFPKGWPSGEDGEKLDKLARWALEGSAERGQPDTLFEARSRTLRSINAATKALQRSLARRESHAR